MRNKRGSVLCLGLVAAMMLFASSLQALPLTSQVYAYTINWSAAADSATQSLVNRFWDVDKHYFVYNADQFENAPANAYWPQAHAMDVIIDAYLRTGDKKYSDMFPLWYEGIKQQNSYDRNGYRNNFYDDSEWIGLTMVRLYEVTKEDKYLATAKDLMEWVKTAWNNIGGGGIAWEKNENLHSKNACSNGPAALLAVRLYEVTKDADYLEWSKKIYNWEKEHLFNPATGAVYDALNGNTGELDKVTLSYNSGTFTGAAYHLFKVTGDETYLNDARKCANFAISDRSMIDTSNNIIRDEGKTDGGLFKGIFMRYFRQLLDEPALGEVYRKKFTTFFNHNAEVLWRNGVNKNNLLFSPSWSTPVVGTTTLTSHVSGCTLLEMRASHE